jgi:hypothetical protein
MRRILLSVLLSLIFIYTNAQTVVLTPLLIKDNWALGYYYDNSGNKISGILKDYIPIDRVFKDHFDYFYFKRTDTSEKEKIMSVSIKSFVVGVDSFTISHSNLLTNKPFLHVLMNESTKLYSSDIKRNRINGRGPGL